MIVGENSRADDMDVNITKEKQQTNIRSATSDNFEKLIPPRRLSLEQCLEFCREDECVEVTAETVRIRKVELDAERPRQDGLPRPQGSADLRVANPRFTGDSLTLGPCSGREVSGVHEKSEPPGSRHTAQVLLDVQLDAPPDAVARAGA